jgi:AraC family transcriptional regulator
MTEVVAKDAAFLRIEKVLAFIHRNIDQPLNIETIAEQSCWSRWQLQRVFQAHLGKSVASYVRELKLSYAAEAILQGGERIIDIATRLGFSSEISFSRSFKQQFQQSPRHYRNSGKRRGLMQPTQASEVVSHLFDGRCRFIEVRVESDVQLSLAGLKTKINGVFSQAPNFATHVPHIWGIMHRQLSASFTDFEQFIGVIDLTNANNGCDDLTYWAAVERDKLHTLSHNTDKTPLAPIDVPKQTYAVIKHQGPVSELPATLMWFLLRWLPDSAYKGISGIELEKYPAGYDPLSEQAIMEDWLPIEFAPNC